MTRLRTIGRRARAVVRAVGAAAMRSAQRVATFTLIGCGAVLVLAGVTLIYPPAGLIGAGLAMFAALTFHPANARKLRWP